MPLKTNQPFDLSILDENIRVDVSAQGTTRSKTHSIKSRRKYIIDNYNWNGIVKLMDFVYQKHDEVYPHPDQLTGTAKDDELIVPDMGICFIISLQLQNAVKKNGLKTSTLGTILKAADGLPGSGFYKNILKKVQTEFLNEADNTAQTDPDTGKKIIPPSKDASPAEFYQFFKKIVSLRNGLWSNSPGVVNLIGLRRVIQENRSRDAGYNDTIACCWVDQAGEEFCELNIATTEPGNRRKARQLFPQTVTVVPGYHNLAQPAGRTRNGLKEGTSKNINKKKELRFNDRIPEWRPGDTTMNFHQGGKSFAYPALKDRKGNNIPQNVWLSNFGFNEDFQKFRSSTKADLETLFKLNLTLTEIYLLLSKYGGNGKNAPYKNMEDLIGHAPAVRKETKDGKIRIQQSGKSDRIVDVIKATNWTLKHWFDGRKNETTKKRIYEVLAEVSDYSPDEIHSWKDDSIEHLRTKFKEEHIERLIDIQIQYSTDIYDRSFGVDGMGGNSFYKMISGIVPKLSAAKQDKIRLDKLIKQLDDFPISKSIKDRFMINFHINTEGKRETIRDETKHLDQQGLDIVNVDVRGWSAGCQVFYDCETFYTFWYNLMKRANDAGQRRWYYTLVDATNFRKSDVIV